MEKHIFWCTHLLHPHVRGHHLVLLILKCKIRYLLQEQGKCPKELITFLLIVLHFCNSKSPLQYI